MKPFPAKIVWRQWHHRKMVWLKMALCIDLSCWNTLYVLFYPAKVRVEWLRYILPFSSLFLIFFLCSGVFFENFTLVTYASFLNDYIETFGLVLPVLICDLFSILTIKKKLISFFGINALVFYSMLLIKPIWRKREFQIRREKFRWGVKFHNPECLPKNNCTKLSSVLYFF